MFSKTKTKDNFDSDYTKFKELNEENLLTLRGNIEKDLADLMDGYYDKKTDKNTIEKLIRKFKALKLRVGNYKTEASVFTKKKEAERLAGVEKQAKNDLFGKFTEPSPPPTEGIPPSSGCRKWGK